MKIKISIIVMLISATMFSQNRADNTIFTSNLNIVNPAFTGRDGNMQMMANHKAISLEGPGEFNTTSNLNFSTPFYKGLGLGANVSHESYSFFSETKMSISGSYVVKLSKKDDFIFGVEFQEGFKNTKFDELNPKLEDPTLDKNLINKNFIPNCSVGIAVKGERYFAHVSTIDILTKAFLGDSSGFDSNYYNIIYFGGGYAIPIGHDMRINSTVLFKAIEGAPFSFDFTSMVNIIENVDVGLTYKYNNSVMANLFFKASESVQLGYSCGLPTNDLLTTTSGTHELFLRLFTKSKYTRKEDSRLLFE